MLHCVWRLWGNIDPNLRKACLWIEFQLILPALSIAILNYNLICVSVPLLTRMVERLIFSDLLNLTPLLTNSAANKNSLEDLRNGHCFT